MEPAFQVAQGSRGGGCLELIQQGEDVGRVDESGGICVVDKDDIGRGPGLKQCAVLWAREHGRELVQREVRTAKEGGGDGEIDGAADPGPLPLTMRSDIENQGGWDLDEVWDVDWVVKSIVVLGRRSL